MSNRTLPASHQGASTWRDPFVIAMLVYYLVMAAVGLWIPDNILKDNPAAREFCDFMAGIVPQIDRITALNIKPDVNRFYSSVLWAGSPIMFSLACWVIFQGRKHSYPMWTMPLQKAIFAIAVLLFLFAWSLYLWNVNPKMSLSRTLFDFSLGRAILGQLVLSTGAVFGLAGAAVWICGWLTGYIPRNIKVQATTL
ncbi:MAG: hypothetical protein HC858_00695 [Brachymonas sp.]|nr:hypothetical protein [Brachymonas sp.]